MCLPLLYIFGFSSGYSTHVPVPRIDYAVKIPDSIPDHIACMLPCSGVTTYWAVLKTKPYVEEALQKFGEARVMCVGAGGLGLWAIQLTKAVYKGKNVKVSQLYLFNYMTVCKT